MIWFCLFSYRMDGGIGAIREILKIEGLTDTRIMSCSVRYVSHYNTSDSYLPCANRLTCQMDPANSHEARHETAMDINQGADVVMIKPGRLCLEVLYRVKQELRVTTFVYQASGGYALHKAVIINDWLDEETVILESPCCFKHTGADGILSWFAGQAAQALRTL